MILKRILSKIADLFFPRRCTICDRVIATDEGICDTCRKKVHPLRGDTCMKCGKKITGNNAYCYDCMRRDHCFERNFSAFEYPVIRESLYRFKYRGRAEYAAYYAREAYKIHGKRIMELHADAIVPVPLHPARLSSRGFNQAQLLAAEISACLSLPLRTDLLRRIKDIASQPSRTAQQRKLAMKGVFVAEPMPPGLRILLVDDVVTSGATLSECARVLRSAGAAEGLCHRDASPGPPLLP